MSTVAHDARVRPATGQGLAFGLASATAFGLSGSLARSLIDAGWTPGAAVTVRILGAVLVLAVPTWLSLRGRWHLIRDNAGFVTAYGIAAVATAQLCFFNAVAYMPVGVALLIEYTAPVAVVAWLWFRHGHSPGVLTLAGAAVSFVGLVLLLDLASGTSVSLPGVLWSLGAMTGAATYFVLSAESRDGLPPIALAGGGLLVGGALILVCGTLRIVPLRASASSVVLAGASVPWWLPAVGLAVVTAALAYVTGIAAVRRLGARLASFVALTEVLAAVIFAVLLLGQAPSSIQVAGGVLVLAGVVLVKTDEGRSG